MAFDVDIWIAGSLCQAWRWRS